MGASPEALLLAPGSELIIRLLPDVIHPRRIAILSPSYGDHAAAWRRAGAEVIETADPLGFAGRVDGVVLVHPNNPDGRVFDARDLENARKAMEAVGGWLIVDEAYGDLSPGRSLAPNGGAGGLIILRSFGKFFGLAGVRLGALIAPHAVCTAMSDRLGIWPVSGAALEIGARAYADRAWQERTRARLASASSRLDAILLNTSLNIVGGTQLYRLVEAANAHGVFQRLARHGLYVRRFCWSDTHLRIGLPATPEAETRLAAALNF